MVENIYPSSLESLEWVIGMTVKNYPYKQKPNKIPETDKKFSLFFKAVQREK